MTGEIPEANPPLSDEERSAAAELTAADLEMIVNAILANSSNRWLKVARVVVATERELANRYPKLSHVFYAQFLPGLVQEGRLESRGNLAYMRFSEVRVPDNRGIEPAIEKGRTQKVPATRAELEADLLRSADRLDRGEGVRGEYLFRRLAKRIKTARAGG